jgi:LCP family protein required for cell wall assembly
VAVRERWRDDADSGYRSDRDSRYNQGYDRPPLRSRRDSSQRPPSGRRRAAAPPPPPPSKAGRHLGRILMSAGVVMLLAAGGASYATYRGVTQVDRNLKRVSVMGGADNKPKVNPLAAGSMNFVMVGSDTRDVNNNSNTKVQAYSDSARTDSIMIMHVNKEHTQAYMVSIPRDSLVSIPGHGKNKVNASFAFGGAKLLRKTVEQLTNVPMDHYLEIDFAGFKQVTDQLGGVDVNVDKAICDERQCWTPGVHHLDGEQALRYVRLRKDLTGNNTNVSDFDRQRRQQQFLHALMTKLTAQGVTKDLTKMQAIVNEISHTITADDGFHALDTAWDLHHIQPTDIKFISLQHSFTDGHDPVAGDVVLLNNSVSDLWKALQTDTVDQWVAAHPDAISDVTHGK